MKLPATLSYLCLALALASGASWGASGKTSDDTAPATPGIGSPPSNDTPGVPNKGSAPATDPTGANGALDMRHVEKKPPQHKERAHPAEKGTHRQNGVQTPAKP